MDEEPDIEITGDTAEWFAFLEAGEFVKRWDLTQRAIALEAESIRADLHREPQLSGQWPTHPTLDASEA